MVAFLSGLFVVQFLFFFLEDLEVWTAIQL